MNLRPTLTQTLTGSEPGNLGKENPHRSSSTGALPTRRRGGGRRPGAGARSRGCPAGGPHPVGSGPMGHDGHLLAPIISGHTQPVVLSPWPPDRP